MGVLHWNVHSSEHFGLFQRQASVDLFLQLFQPGDVHPDNLRQRGVNIFLCNIVIDGDDLVAKHPHIAPEVLHGAVKSDIRTHFTEAMCDRASFDTLQIG